MTLHVTKLEPNDLSVNEIAMLLRSVYVGKEDWNTVAKHLADGSAVAWRILGGSTRGVMVTEVVSGALHVWHLAGVDLWRKYKSIIKAVQEIAVRNKLSGITGQSTPTIAKLLARHGFATPRSVVEWRT